MRKRSKKKVFVAVLIVLIGIGFLIYRGVSSTGIYYLTVEELIKKAHTLKGESVRVSGNVVDGTIDYNAKDLILKFAISDMKNENKKINALYNGIKPDAFKPGGEVILEGVYDEANNLFKAEILLAKCPSKYEEEIKEGEE
jgi:cytochrome c-type biogenesis protein CcmE